ncbi:MAG TPA: hypothetical protein VIR33_07540, partial [Thermopolyspora sp.]
MSDEGRYALAVRPPSSMRPASSPARPLSSLAALLGAPSDASAKAPRGVVTGITFDSRRVRPGDLYVAMPGKAAHGA